MSGEPGPRGGLLGALTRNRSATAPDHPDPRMRGRRYGIPYRVVWDSARKLADGGIRGWALVEVGEREGTIRVRARTLLRFVDDVEIRVGLDAEGQTRVDLTSASRVGRGDLGKNARRIRRFLARLDRRLGREGWPTAPPGTPRDTTG